MSGQPRLPRLDGSARRGARQGILGRSQPSVPRQANRRLARLNNRGLWSAAAGDYGFALALSSELSSSVSKVWCIERRASRTVPRREMEEQSMDDSGHDLELALLLAPIPGDLPVGADLR